MRVGLITTGHMELRGLSAALGRAFPEHEFIAVPYAPGRPHDSFTSARVRPIASPDGALPTRAGHLVEAAVGCLHADTRCDLAFILEDLELANLGNVAAVIDHVRGSARRFAARVRAPTDPEAVLAELATRVSFHLAVPMTESWFFGDPGVLLVAGVPSDRLPPRLAPGCDPEQFLAEDPAYLADDGAACVASRKPPIWSFDQRALHPKAYLSWLARHPQQRTCTTYEPGEQGKRALKAVRLSHLANQAASYPYLRSLLRDLEAGLGVPARTVSGDGPEAPLTSLTGRPADHVLRNL